MFNVVVSNELPGCSTYDKYGVMAMSTFYYKHTNRFLEVGVGS